MLGLSHAEASGSYLIAYSAVGALALVSGASLAFQPVRLHDKEESRTSDLGGSSPEPAGGLMGQGRASHRRDQHVSCRPG